MEFATYLTKKGLQFRKYEGHTHRKMGKRHKHFIDE